MSFLSDMARQAFAGDKRDCGRCLSSETCARLNREDTAERRDDDDALCYVVTMAVAEHRRRGKAQQAKKGG